MKLTILHLFSDILNQAGDAGNILCLTKRCEWRNIETELIGLDYFDSKTGLPNNFNELEADFFDKVDIVFVGSGFDKQLETIITNDSISALSTKLKKYVENDGVLLAIDAGYHLLGELVEISDADMTNVQSVINKPTTGNLVGNQSITNYTKVTNHVNKKIIKGFSICNYTTNLAATRMVGDIILDSDLVQTSIVGFENHIGLVDIKDLTPLGKIELSMSPQGVERPKLEGVHYKNFIGTDLHGPLLSKNPKLADYLLLKALGNKGFSGKLIELEDTAENKANTFVVDRLCTLVGVSNLNKQEQVDEKRA